MRHQNQTFITGLILSVTQIVILLFLSTYDTGTTQIIIYFIWTSVADSDGFLELKINQATWSCLQNLQNNKSDEHIILQHVCSILATVSYALMVQYNFDIIISCRDT